MTGPTASEMGAKGGKARAASMSKKQRKEAAKLAADARWAKERARQQQQQKTKGN